jgi:putative RNA 2'-phosphotransferase
MSVDPVQLSKFLSFVLRHKPDAIGLALDPQGWASIDELTEKANAAGTQFGREDLLHVVETSDKKRFSVSDDGQRIRAAQGHSVSVELGLSPQVPPPVLYHGTATRFVESILSEGLRPQDRQHVHCRSTKPLRSASASVMASRSSSRSKPFGCTRMASSSSWPTTAYG